MSSQVRDNVEGILFGLAAGDRNGGPVRMAVRLAESLVERRSLDPDDVGRRYLQWWRSGAFDTGPVSAGVLRLVDGGSTFHDAAVKIDKRMGGLTAGCNPAHRCAPLAMANTVPDGRLREASGREAALTHRHPLAGATSGAVALLCRLLVNRVPWAEALVTAGEGLDEQVRADLDPGDGEGRGLRTGGFSPDVLAAAVHFLDRARTFEDALTRALSFAGPANYCPVLVGSIGGARWGRAAIPEAMLRHCEIIDRVGRAAALLAAGW